LHPAHRLLLLLLLTQGLSWAVAPCLLLLLLRGGCSCSCCCCSSSSSCCCCCLLQDLHHQLQLWQGELLLLLLVGLEHQGRHRPVAAAGGTGWT
jgi:hypothetical protein